MRTVSGRTGRRQMRINRPCAQRAERIRAACCAAALRATCRWFEQHGRLACAACPEVIRRPTPG
jgi:hypothetical protein